MRKKKKAQSNQSVTLSGSLVSLPFILLQGSEVLCAGHASRQQTQGVAQSCIAAAGSELLAGVKLQQDVCALHRLRLWVVFLCAWFAAFFGFFLSFLIFYRSSGPIYCPFTYLLISPASHYADGDKCTFSH